MRHIDIHHTAAKLCEDAEKIALDNPSENMISDCLLNVVCNTLNAAVETANEIDGCQDSQVMKMYRLLKAVTGPLAENAANDMDHHCLKHPEWYRRVKEARALLATIRLP